MRIVVRDWARAHPAVADWALVALLVVPTSIGWLFDPHRQPVLALLVQLTACGALAWRRRFPLSVLATVGAALVAHVLAGLSPNVLGYTMVVGVYSAAVYASRSRVVAAHAAAYLAVGVAALSSPEARGGGLVGFLVFMTASWVLGDTVRSRRARMTEMEQRAARLEQERDAQGQVATAAERARIAREMHDVVAHTLSVMVAQADGAAYVFDTDPERARAAMATVADTGRIALAEMHRMLGVLRSEGSDGELAPQPGVEQLDALLSRMHAAGLPVTLRVQGRPRPLDAGMSLTVYRLVQEALTNTLKHAGAGTHATVRLCYRTDDIEVEVDDDGKSAGGLGSGRAAMSSGGHGLAGMRERTAVYGGTLHAGPRAGGGWRIKACLPVEVSV